MIGILMASMNVLQEMKFPVCKAYASHINLVAGFLAMEASQQQIILMYPVAVLKNLHKGKCSYQGCVYTPLPLSQEFPHLVIQKQLVALL